MAVRPITVLPQDAAVLRRTAHKIRRIDDSHLRLVADMIDSMYAANGVGLAAPQIGVPLRVIVIGLPSEPPFAIVNPEIVKSAGERRVLEGCLSLPGYRGEIVRAERIWVKGRTLSGREIRIRAANDLLAQALEHEINHVNGILFIDHLESLEDLIRLADLPPEDLLPSHDEDGNGDAAQGPSAAPPD